MRKWEIPQWVFYVIFGCCLLGIVFGSFFDLDVSSTIASLNGDNPFGMLGETVLSFFCFGTVGFGAGMVAKGLFHAKPKRKAMLVSAIILLVLGTLIGTYLIGYNFDGSNAKEVQYGYRVPYSWLAYLVGFFVNAGFMAIGYFLPDKEKPRQALFVGAIFLFAMLFQWAVIELLKGIGGRPRYRFLYGDFQGTYEGIKYNFKQWFEFAFYKNPRVDYFKSWPSGHSGAVASMLALGFLPTALKWRFKHDCLFFFLIGLAYSLTIVISRIVAGAHFLSDVSLGFLIGSFGLWIAVFAFKKISNKVGKIDVKEE